MGGCCASKDRPGEFNDVERDFSWYPSNYHSVFAQDLVGMYSTHGKRGRDAKQNQDVGLAVPHFAGNPEQMFFLVCDGHGSVGHKVSQLASKSIITFLENDPRMKDMVTDDDFTTGPVVQALTEACEKSQVDLKRAMPNEALHSGTTCICTAIHKNHVWTACVGDSRAVVGAVKGTKTLALDLSADQCCTNASEKARIIAHGGKIVELCGFERVVSPNQNTMLAPTRSIGDCEFDVIGVVPRPEVTHFKLTGQEHVIILASDGLWEFISSTAAVTHALRCQNATEACDKLVQLSKTKWSQDGPGTYCDDITIIVIFLPLIPGQMGSHAVAIERVGAQSAVLDPNGVDIELDVVDYDPKGAQPDVRHSLPANESHTPAGASAGNPESRRRSISGAHLEGAKSKNGIIKADSSNITSDNSIIRIVKDRNTDNYHGLCPHSKDNVDNHSWAPEWDKTMWPRS